MKLNTQANKNKVIEKLHNPVAQWGSSYDQLPWSHDQLQFNNVDIVYSDFVQRITPVINKIAVFQETRIKNYTQDWFDGEILDKVILRDKALKKLEVSRLNIDEQLHEEAKTNV